MKHFLSIILFISYSLIGMAQNASKNLVLADTLFSKKHFAKSISYYKKFVEANSLDSTAICHSVYQLYKANQAIANTSDAQVYLSKYIKTCPSNNEDLLSLADILIQLNSHEKAKKVLSIFISRDNQNLKAQRFLQSCDSALLWQNNQDYLIENEENINTSFDELSPQYLNNNLYFSSSRENTLIKPKSDFNSQPPLSIYTSPRVYDKLKKCKPYNTNQDIEPSLISFSVDQTELYATVQNSNNQQLKIYRASISNKEIGKFESFVYNNDTCSFAQACLSPNGTVIYFVSDMKGGFGGTDIYYCEKKNGKWSKPINMGATINTSENELFPNLYNGYILYFSSNGKVGMGGYDLYKATFKNNEWVDVENLKFPINSSKDELNIFFETSHNGYISSNRKQGKGGFDIYRFRKR